MRRIDNIIFAILIFCLLICGLLWYQLSQYKLSQRTPVKTEKSKTTISLPGPPSAQALVDLPNERNIFKLPQKEEEVSEVVDTTLQKETLPKPHLSTICWSEELSLAVVNGKILTTGDKDSKSQFKIETITRDKVGIRFTDNGEFVWLRLAVQKK